MRVYPSSLEGISARRAHAGMQSLARLLLLVIAGYGQAWVVERTACSLARPIVGPRAAPQSLRCSSVSQDEEEVNRKRKQQVAGTLGTVAVGGQLLFPLLVGLARLGIIDLPPLNCFTKLANNAADEAIRLGEISPLTGTVYGQGVWKDLVLGFYSNGKTTEFLTGPGGVCAQHAAWCEGVTIPLAGGLTGAAQVSAPLPF